MSRGKTDNETGSRMNTRMKRYRKLKLVAVEAENSVVRETWNPSCLKTWPTDQALPEQRREYLEVRWVCQEK